MEHKFTANYKTAKLCVFCKYWFNPAMEDVVVRFGGFTDFERDKKCHCLQRNNLLTRSVQTCPKFSLREELKK